MLGETKQFCVLVNNATETGWFKQLLNLSDMICLLSKRVKFLNNKGEPVGAPLQGQIILYYGDNDKLFTSEFSKHGSILKVIK